MLQLVSLFDQLIFWNITVVEAWNLRIATYIFPYNTSKFMFIIFATLVWKLYFTNPLDYVLAKIFNPANEVNLKCLSFINYRIYSSISRIFLYQNITQKIRCDLYMNTWSALYAVQNFLRCFQAMYFYAVSLHMIISLVAFYASSLALLTLPPFFHVLTRLVITYPHKSWWVASLAILMDADEDVPEVNRAIWIQWQQWWLRWFLIFCFEIAMNE